MLDFKACSLFSLFHATPRAGNLSSFIFAFPTAYGPFPNIQRVQTVIKYLTKLTKKRNPEVQCYIAITRSVYFFFNIFFLCFHFTSYFFPVGGSESLLLPVGSLYLRCVGFSLRGFSCCGARALGRMRSGAVVHGLSHSTACGLFPEQGLNPCPRHWQVDS